MDIVEMIDISIKDGIKCRIYFKDNLRTPIFGKFVAHKDHNEMLGKGMIRFVNENKLDLYENDKHVMFTKLFVIKDFKDIKLF